MSVAADGLTEAILYFRQRRKCKRISSESLSAITTTQESANELLLRCPAENIACQNRLVSCRPRLLAQVAPPATGGAPIAPSSASPFGGEICNAVIKAPSVEGAAKNQLLNCFLAGGEPFFSPSVNCPKSAIDSSLIRGSLFNCPINRNY